MSIKPKEINERLAKILGIKIEERSNYLGCGEWDYWDEFTLPNGETYVDKFEPANSSNQLRKFVLSEIGKRGLTFHFNHLFIMDKFLDMIGGRSYKSAEAYCTLPNVTEAQKGYMRAYTALVQTVADNTMHLLMLYGIFKVYGVIQMKELNIDIFEGIRKIIKCGHIAARYNEKRNLINYFNYIIAQIEYIEKSYTFKKNPAVRGFNFDGEFIKVDNPLSCYFYRGIECTNPFTKDHKCDITFRGIDSENYFPANCPLREVENDK